MFEKIKGFVNVRRKMNKIFQKKQSEESKEDSFVVVSVDIPDDVFIEIALAAHREDITFNAMINKILEKYVRLNKMSSELKEWLKNSNIEKENA